VEHDVPPDEAIANGPHLEMTVESRERRERCRRSDHLVVDGVPSDPAGVRKVAPFGSVPGYPNVWWGACNTSSLFVADYGSRWIFTTNDPNLNEDMEVYVR
jgi:hypothetical protein